MAYSEHRPVLLTGGSIDGVLVGFENGRLLACYIDFEIDLG